ncbi:MAG TPA: type VII secretion protein EssA [Lactococcus sp.]|nr:type VII secretion protein EssA [Lactococcus sp.]
MQIRLQNVMPKMHKASDSNIERLLWRFFQRDILIMKFVTFVLLLAIFSPINVKADSNGSLKLNTDILTGNQSQAGSVGDFPVRGRLFTKELEEQSKNLGLDSKQVVENIKTVDFSVKTDGTKSDSEVKKYLFQNYKSQVIISDNKEDSQQVSWFVMLSIPVMIVILFVGIFSGRWWTRKQRRKVRN